MASKVRSLIVAILVLGLFAGPACALDVEKWLTDLGLAQYTQSFRENAVTDYETVRSLTDDDLKSLGVAMLGHRKKILAAISDLDVEDALPSWNLDSWLTEAGFPQYSDHFRKNALDSKESVAGLS